MPIGDLNMVALAGKGGLIFLYIYDTLGAICTKPIRRLKYLVMFCKPFLLNLISTIFHMQLDKRTSITVDSVLGHNLISTTELSPL